MGSSFSLKVGAIFFRESFIFHAGSKNERKMGWYLTSSINSWLSTTFDDVSIQLSEIYASVIKVECLFSICAIRIEFSGSFVPSSALKQCALFLNDIQKSEFFLLWKNIKINHPPHQLSYQLNLNPIPVHSRWLTQDTDNHVKLGVMRVKAGFKSHKLLRHTSLLVSFYEHNHKAQFFQTPQLPPASAQGATDCHNFIALQRWWWCKSSWQGWKYMPVTSLRPPSLQLAPF